MYIFESHNAVTIKGISWLVCRYCGLIYLQNKITRWCIKKGCNSKAHPEYRYRLLRD